MNGATCCAGGLKSRRPGQARGVGVQRLFARALRRRTPKRAPPMELLDEASRRRVESGAVPLMSDDDKAALLELLQLVHESRVDYVVGSGTMLGMARHGGFIPWDEDADVYVAVDAMPALLQFLATKQPEVVVALSGQGAQVWLRRRRRCTLDVFAFAPDETGKHCMAGPIVDGRPTFAIAVIYYREAFDHDVLYPPKHYDFEGVRLLGPQQLELACKIAYGPDCFNVAKLPDEATVSHGTDHALRLLQWCGSTIEAAMRFASTPLWPAALPGLIILAALFRVSLGLDVDAELPRRCADRLRAVARG